MSCGSIPNVLHSAIEGRNKEVYEPGETIRYQCDEGFEAVGLPEIICRKGNWSRPPLCEGACSISKVCNPFSLLRHSLK